MHKTIDLIAAIFAFLFSLVWMNETTARDPKDPETAAFRFYASESGSFTFNTGVLQGVLRHEGASIGMVPVLYLPDSISISTGSGLYNHYRVFTKGKRYGYGARRWPSTAELKTDGSVEVHWPYTPDRPFELQATYRWVAPNTLDLFTTVIARSTLESFEVFLASYFGPEFTDSQVYASKDPRGGRKSEFISADRELGDWLAFPRDPKSSELINDGRWNLEPSPIDWTIMPPYKKPLAFRRNPATGLTVVVLAKQEDCFGIYTPYGEEKHISNYLSLFGTYIEAGETARAHTRLVVLRDPSVAEIHDAYDSFVETSH